ncbi:MAG: LysR family transcriptional regulator [Pseudomonadota bacterium]
MSRPKSKREAAGQRDRPGLRVKIYMADDMIGGGKVHLLKLVAKEGSILGAARAMGVDYKRAWFLLETLQRCFEAPLFVTKRSGANRGAALTPLGHEVIMRHDAHLSAVTAASADYLDWLASQQRVSDRDTDPAVARPGQDGMT